MSPHEMLNVLGWSDKDIASLQFVIYSYIKQGKYEIAKVLLEGLEALDPSNLYTLQTLGAIYLETKDPYKALDKLEKASKLDPSNETILYNRTQALISLGLKKQALEESSRLLQAQNPLIKQRAEAFLLSAAIG